MPSTYCRPADILPKVLPFAIPEKMMELKRRPTVHDIRGSAYQLRHRHAPPDQQVPWNRVYFWPFKAVHVMTDQERNPPPKRRRKRVVQKGPKVVKAPPTPVPEKKFAPKSTVHYNYKHVVNYVKRFIVGAWADEGAAEAASADNADVVSTTTAPTANSVPSPTLSGASLNDDDASAADVDAQIQSAADDEAQPSLLAAVFKFGVDLIFGPREPKRAHEDDNESGDAKRRRVGSDAQAPVRAEAQPAAGKAARSNTTGATAPKHHNSTATAAKRRARNAPKASLDLCPPSTGSAPVACNAKAVKARSLMPPPRVPARPIVGRPSRKRADTPDPRAGTPPPPPSDQQASSASSTPTSSPSSSRSSSPASKRSARSSSSKAAKSQDAHKSSKPAFVSKELGPGETLLPVYISWSHDNFVNPWDPRAPAAPDPRYPWAPANTMWANARPAPIAPLPSTAPPSFQRPVSLRELGRVAPVRATVASTSSTATSRLACSPAAPTPVASTSRRGRSASPASEDFSGEETEVESGGEETDDEE